MTPATPTDRGITTLIEGLGFPETPRCVGDCVWFAEGSRIRCVDASGNARVHAELPGQLLGIQPYEHGWLASVAPLRQIHWVSPAGDHALLHDLGAYGETPINEVLVVGKTLFVGQMGFDPRRGEQPVKRQLLRISATGDVAAVGPGLVFANGMAHARKRNSLIVAESQASRITEIPLLPGGDLGEPRLFADVSSIGGKPDGLCLLPDDTLWYAAGGELIRIADGGAVLDRIPTPFPFVSSCAVALDGQTIYLTALGRRDADGAGLLAAAPLTDPPTAQRRPVDATTRRRAASP